MIPQWSLIKSSMLFHTGGLQTPGGGLPILWLTNQYKQKKNPLRCSGTPRMSGRPFTALSPGNTAALCIIFIQSDKKRTCTRSRKSENLRCAWNKFSFFPDSVLLRSSRLWLSSWNSRALAREFGLVCHTNRLIHSHCRGGPDVTAPGGQWEACTGAREAGTCAARALR